MWIGITLISLSFAWLLWETAFLSIRLPYGKCYYGIEIPYHKCDMAVGDLIMIAIGVIFLAVGTYIKDQVEDKEA